MLVSVIIPCYNQGNYLNETLESVYNQTYTDWECIIVDDGSTDETNVVSNQWVEKDNRFKYFYKDNNGVSSARNLGIQKSTGKYFQFIDSDDLLEETKIEVSLNLLNDNFNSNVIVSNFKMVSSDSKTITDAFCKLKKELFTLENFLYQWNKTFSVQVQCGFFEASLFDTISFPENLSAQEDWVVWIELFKKNAKFIFIDKPLALYRIHPTSRMMTLGIDDNQIKILDNFREILSSEEYYKFSKYLLSESYSSNVSFKSEIKKIKTSNIYQSGLMIRKVIKTFGLLKPSRFIFNMILKLKAK
jgi:glycosyltransferase involved in cell wall biosynthesis